MKWVGLLLLLVLRQRNRFCFRLKAKRWRAATDEIAYLQSSGRNTGSTLVFLHGLGAGKDQWGPQIYSLVDAHRCLFLDLPGEGESSFDGTQSYSPVSQVERLKAFLDALAIKDVVLIGSSIGGCIACLYAATYPDQVSRLIAMAPAGLPASRLSPAMSQFLASGKHPFGYRCVSEMQDLWSIAFTRPPKVPAFLATALAIKGGLRYARVGKILEDFKGGGLYPLQVQLSDVQARTLIIWESNDRVFDISCLDEVSRLLPEANVCIIEEAGHVPYLECADQTLDVIQRFLA
ncbi:alpha/beta fold hydrolase [Pseudomonas sp. NA-150]|uniref:alpha/beta fold hydrolase n=1 Tax=Pseudomonas sp. NA-150 TaxID=3367525 RepID=UPI0037C53B26